MQVGNKIWLDGQIQNLVEAKFSLLSHSLHYGSAFFEGLRFYETLQGPAIFRLKEHIARFFHSAEAIQFHLPYSEDKFLEAVVHVVNLNEFSQGYIRFLGFFGEGDMELHPTQALLHTAIILWPWKPRMGTKSIRVKISSFMRTPPECTTITAKLSGHYANSILARQEARKEGYDEALLLDERGYIAEASGANFFVVKNNHLITPPSSHIFAGITRDTILNIAKNLDISCHVDNIDPRELLFCDEAFLTGTAMELISIESINDQQIANAIGSMATKLKTQYLNIVQGKDAHYYHWLTFLHSQQRYAAASL